MKSQLTPVQAASAEAVDAAQQSEQLAVILAMVQAAQLTQQQAPAAPVAAPVQRHSGSAAKWIGIGVGGSIFLMTIALSAVAVAISTVALTICVLVLRSVVQDIRKSH